MIFLDADQLCCYWITWTISSQYGSCCVPIVPAISSATHDLGLRGCMPNVGDGDTASHLFGSRVVVTKQFLSSLLLFRFFKTIKVHLNYQISSSYLPDIVADQLWNLSVINVI